VGSRDLMAARVAIGVPTYNRCASLERALRSALAQDYPDLVVIVSDNASTDATESVCRALVQENPRLRYCRQAKNIGGIANFRAVFDLADTELFMWLADDDWIDSGFVSACVAALDAEPAAVLAGARGRYESHGEFSHEGTQVVCDSPSPFVRVLQYYRKVDDNAIFYGVMRIACARKVDVLVGAAGDWTFVAGLAFQGTVRTVERVHIHRALGGTSRSREHMVRALGLPRWQAAIPLSFTLPGWFARDVLRNPVYAGLATPVRILFAAVVACWTFFFKPAQALARRLVHGRL
jgi:glycosyltransferase involved in cell wall biosynthesis